MTRAITIAVLLAVAVGCDELPSGSCDTSAASSVTVSVVDGTGNLTPADDVTYDVDNLGEVGCDPLDADGYEWVCGYEETGEFLILAYVGSSVYDATVSVGMRADGCHVESQFIDITVN
ncbi:MAG: hypothetical protein EP330_26925 [Deltaproteobacteria bacterium]|nr:MAG: hypothetical protein EP330_26925 [Deltaproteobacteria bacterium]